MKINEAVFNHFPVLETERLLLRELNESDAKHIFNIRASSRVAEFIFRPLMQHEQQATELVEKTKNAFITKTGIGWAVQTKISNQFIGTCGFNQIDWPNLRAEIGGEMDVQFWGKRYPLGAVNAILNFGFNQLGLMSVEAKVVAGNRSAIYLLTELGFVKEAHFKNRIYAQGAFYDLCVYTLFKK